MKNLTDLGPLSRRLLAAQAAQNLADLDLLRPPALCEACGDKITGRSYGRYHQACIERLVGGLRPVA